MMGYSVVGLLLLLCGFALAQQGSETNEPSSACQLVSRFKTYRKYLYQYTTENRNGVVGTANLRNGPKVTCKVEIEVPRACGFIMQTTECSVSEVSVMDTQGQPVYTPAPGSDAFQAAMEKNPLKFSVENAVNVELYPEVGEPVNILNIKRGIISALLSPSTEENNSVMSTVHGLCRTTHQVNALKDIAVDVTISRDLSQCDQFYSRRHANSPLALLKNMHYPLSKLITSSQECSYQFDPKGKHITAVMCNEKHIYLPFSQQDNGMSSVITQELSFQNSKRINNRVFDVLNNDLKPLHFEDPDDKAPVQTKDATINTLTELLALSGTDQGQKRAGLFHKLVSNLRALGNETLSQTVAEMQDMSVWSTWQALFQCGTPECTSAMFQSIWKIEGVSAEVDALVYALGLKTTPTASHLRDMLSMAQYRQSKGIMYALAYTVKNFYRGDITPEIRDVAKFMEEMLNDCSGELGPNMDPDVIRNPQELSYLVLRVVGVMGQPMQDSSPSLLSAILKCAKKTDAPLSTQKAAIQAFRNTVINDEVKSTLLEIYQDAQSPVEKRVAAYFILMNNNMDEPTAKVIVDTIEDITEEELRAFLITHLNNVLRNDLQATYYIQMATRDKGLPAVDRLSGKSRNFMNDIFGASFKSNIVFDDANTLPKDVSLDISYDKDYNYYDLFKIHFEGDGFEPTINALFDKNGFFPELMNLGEDKAQMLKDLLSSYFSDDSRMKRQAPGDLLKGISDGIQKLIEDLRSSPAPEAIAYFELLGLELGYMKTSQIRDVIDTLFLYHHVFFRILPSSALLKLTSSTNNEAFVHYIFMENSFSLPTTAGLPLKFSLAGVFAPGAKGGLTYSPSMGELSFMPSVGMEFITNFGVHIPDYVEAGLEMHTNMHHESSLNAKINLHKNEIKFTIPAPTANTQLFSISNKVLSVSAGQTKIVPSLVEDRTDSTDCQPLITGLKLCTIMRYSNATSIDQAPYYPLTGESRFALEIQPTGEVSEYIATMTRETLRGERQKVTALKLVLKAEGVDSAELTATLKYNHNKNTVTTELNIPDTEIEAGIKFALTDSDPKAPGMRGITIDVTNKNIPQLSLIGRTRLEMMKEAMLQLQLTIPSLNADASLTTTLKKDEIITLDFETAVNLPETLYQQKVSLKYDDDKIELELKSDANSDIQKLIPNAEDHHRQLQQLIDEMLDQKVAKTDMKLRHIVTKGIEAANIWLDKLTAQFPYLEKLRSKRSISDLTLPPLPEKLFLQYDGLFRYQFNKDRLAISLPLPLGGKTSEDLNIPPVLSYPEVDLTKIGLYIPANKVKLPQFTIPPSLDFTVPLLGLAEASAKINSNVYSWEGSISGGNDTKDTPNYILHYKIMAQSPFCLLSYKLEGTGMVTGSADDSLKYLLSSAFNHCLIDTNFSIVETFGVTDKLNAKADYKIEIFSPLGIETTWFYTAQATSTPEPDEVSGDGTLDGKLKIGSYNAEMTYTQSYNLRPLDREGRGESSLVFNCPLIKLQNIIQGVYANSELNIISKTNALDDALKHVAELKFKDGQLTLKCNGMAMGMGNSLNNKVELGVSDQMALFRIESQADDAKNRLYSLITGSLDFNGLDVTSEGSLIFDLGRGLHKASLTIGKNGLATSGTNNIQCSPVTVENIFNGAIDSSGALFSTKTKAMGDESRGELNINAQVTSSEATLQGVLKGHAFDGTTRNNMNIVLNRNGLGFTADMMGALNQMKTENSHSLTVTLWTVNLRSKSNNYICEDVYYKQDTKVNMQPFVATIDMTNDLKLYELGLNNEGHLKLQPTNLDLNGNVMGMFGDEKNFKHTYEINFAGLEGGLISSSSANAMDAQLSHNCEFKFAGLSSTTKCEARINSQPLRLDSSLRIMALPFSLSIDGLVNGDGEVKLNGKHTGQLYSRFLIKGEPLSLAYTHDNRLSTTHKPRRNADSTTNLDSKLEGLWTLNNQVFSWKLKSKLNDHAYNQDVSAYNNPEKIGAEFSVHVLTDLVSRMTINSASPVEEEFSISGLLKYDKNTECHIIEFPFIESFPVAFEQAKTALVQALESIQQFINNLDINLMIKNFQIKLDELPKEVSDFMQEIDLENKVVLVKSQLDYLANEFSITFEDLEKAMNNFKMDLEETVTDIATKIQDFIITLKDYVQTGELNNKILNLLQDIGDYLWAFEGKYEIKQILVKLLDAIEDILSQIDLEKLTESSTAWLKDLDAQYGILDQIKDVLSQTKEAIENFDIKIFFQDVKDYIFSLDLAEYLEQLQYTIPYSDIKRVMDDMNLVIVNWIDEYEIPQKLNAVYSYIKDQILKYNLDDKFKELMDQLVVLVNDFKIKETVQSMVDTLKEINFQYAYDKMMNLLQGITDFLKEIDFKKLIEDLNNNISNLVKSMEEFDYHVFVDEANKKIEELTDYTNEQIKMYEIVKKIEAVRDFFREIQSTVYTYLDGLKNTKLADALVKLKDVIDTTFYNDIKLKALDVLDDIRERISNMDIRDEMNVYLQRASEFYTNTIELISTKLTELAEKIANLLKNSDIVDKVKAGLGDALNALKEAEIEVPTFTVPLTDLVIPGFTVNLNKLEEISIPAQITIPEFTILNTKTIPACTIDFEEIKAKIVAFIDELKMFEIQSPDLHEIFGDLKVLYLSDLPDFTFPEITLSELKVPTITVPKLHLEAFEITMLPIPPIELPKIPCDVCVPVFGKLSSEFQFKSPQYTLTTTWMIQNATTTPKNPLFTAMLNSEATSPFKPLEHTLEFNAKLEAPRMKKMLFTETLKATHIAFMIDHEGSLSLASSSAEATAKTNAKATTPIYNSELQNNIVLTLKGGISAAIDTMYNHNLDLPSLELSSQCTVKHTDALTLESGKVSATAETMGDCKWTIEDYSDEGVHKNKLDFTVDLGTAKLTFEGETDSKCFKSKESLMVESVILSHVILSARCEMDIPSLKKSLTVLDAEAHIGDLKLVIAASHDTEFTGSLKGTAASTFDFKAHPFEIILDAKNKANTKIFLPLKLSGKLDFQNDYCLILNSEKQKACWLALARFNQYKYNHNFVMENNDKEIFFHSDINGEANLDFLTIPLSVPEMTIPYIELNTPIVTDFSLWEHTGLKYLLTTPQQSFDMNFKLHYFKNPESHSFDLYIEPLYNAISENANIIQEQFEMLRGKIVSLLKESYSQVKKRYIKHKKDTSSLPPRIITIPGYKIPLLNIEVSAFTAELPAVSYVVPKEVSTPSFKIPALDFSVPSYTLVLPSLELPIIHVPEALSDVQLPTFTFPEIQNIVIPAMGNLTLDFSFKSAVIAVSANGGLFNQSDIVARFTATSSSVFDVLNGKMDGTSSLTRKRGIKLATTISLEHQNVQGNYECAVSLSKRSIETSIANTVKINFPFLNLELDQDIAGNSQTTPCITAKNKLKYMFNIPMIDSTGKGTLDIYSELETLSSYISLDTSTQGKSDITILGIWNIAQDLDNKVTFYLNANGLRTTFATSASSNIDKQDKQKRSSEDNIVHFDLVENIALELSLRRMYATFDYTTNNNVNLEFLTTNGNHVAKGELDLVPLKSFKITLDIDVKQPSNLGHIGHIQYLNLAFTSEKQSFSWLGKEQFASFIHACNLIMSNDEVETRIDLSESMEGHLDFLKSIKIPVYQKNLWDVLKLDQVTKIDKLQVLNISSSVVYTKSMAGQEYAIPSKLFENGVTFNIPEFSIAVPGWVKEIPSAIRKIDMRFEETEIPDHVTIPPTLSIPEFDVPFTNLHVEPFTFDLKNLNIPKVIQTREFDIMVPGLPVISVPSYEINTEYLQGKMSYLSFKIPQYEITVSSFTLPKSITIGDTTIDLDDIKTHISNFELPTIVIPEQKIEIPEVDLHLPSSVFIPSFGALSATFKVASPIYMVSTTASVEKRDSSLVTDLKSICTSTMIFLEYDLMATATIGFDNGVLSLNGKCDLVHSDINVKWQHVFERTLRMKRQTSSSDSNVYRHTLIVDITSPIFADVGYRFAARKDGITASVSSPSTGFLGLHLQKRSPSQLFGKLFVRYLATPEKDTDILTFKATLKNAQKLTLQSSWNMETLWDVMEGTKDRIPAMTEAILKMINKYHTAHFGFDLNRGGLKLKNTVSNFVERAYHEFPLSSNELQNSIEQLSYNGMDMYRRASDDLMSFNLRDFIMWLNYNLKELDKRMWLKISELDAAIQKYLDDTTFTLPGSDEQISGSEIARRVRSAYLRATNRAMQRFVGLLEKIASYIKEIYFTIPGTEFIVNGQEILTQIERSVRNVMTELRHAYSEWSKLIGEKIQELYHLIVEKCEDLINYLNDENKKIASQVAGVYAELKQSSKDHIAKASGLIAENKDSTKEMIHKVYIAFDMDLINEDTKDLISFLQSNLHNNFKNSIDLMSKASESTAPYVKMSNKRVDIEIPLPFLWKSFSEWPTQKQ